MRKPIHRILYDHITLEGGSEFCYSIVPFELKNALGNIVAVLDEYTFTKIDEKDSNSCKLYRTKEGNWYDAEDLKNDVYKAFARKLKSAFDAAK